MVQLENNMKYYKRLVDIKTTFPCKKGMIYPEDFSEGHFKPVSKCVYAYPEHWQEVTFLDYCRQEYKPLGKEDIEVGVVYLKVPMSETPRKIIRIEDNRMYYEESQGGFNYITELNSDHDSWFLVSSPKKEFVLPEKWALRNPHFNESQLIYDYFNSFKGKMPGYYPYNGGSYFHFPSYDGTCITSSMIKNNHTEITFDQFKKYVLNKDTMENKKISHYILTKTNYANAAIKIMGTGFPSNGSYKVSVDTCIEKLKDAGVLDLWFEPVYESEFRVGDWIMFDGYNKAGPYKLQIVNGANSKDVDGYTRELTCGFYRLATAEEIKKASSKFQPGDYVRWLGSYSTVGIIEKRSDFAGGEWYVLRETSLEGEYTSCSVKNLIKITKEEYDLAFGITICGYKAEFTDTHVAFGCQPYHKDFVLQLGIFLEKSGLKIESQNEIMQVVNIIKRRK